MTDLAAYRRERVYREAIAAAQELPSLLEAMERYRLALKAWRESR